MPRSETECARRLEREAARDEHPPAQLAVRAIRAMIQTRQAKRAAIDAALAEAEEGRFISEDTPAQIEVLRLWDMRQGAD